MDNDMTQVTEALGESFSHRRLPRWNELPDIDLYMDQVLALIERYLGGDPGFDGKGLTASMVNNYVKLGVMPAPSRKKYNREHLAHIIMICVLKASLPISAISRINRSETASIPLETVYDSFCDLFERTGLAVAESFKQTRKDPNGPSLHPIYYAALRAQAEQALAMRLFDQAFSDEQKQ